MQLSVISDQIHEDLETAFSILHQEGYELVELHNVFGHSIETCTMQEVQKIRELLRKYHLKVSNIASTIFFLCPLYPKDRVSLFNPSFYSIQGDCKEHLDILKNACRVAEELECSQIRIFPFRWPDNRKGPYGSEEDYQRIVANIQRAVEIAEAEKITLVLENCPYSHLPKGKMTLQVVQAIQSPYLKLLWDPANSYRAIDKNVPDGYKDWNLEEELMHVYPYIGHVHIKNYCYDTRYEKPYVHVPVFEGDIDYNRLLRILEQNHYQGICSLEPEVGYEDVLSSMRKAKETVFSIQKEIW